MVRWGKNTFLALGCAETIHKGVKIKMRHENGMVCIITTKGAIFSDKERLNPDNLPEEVKEAIKKEEKQ